MDTAGREKFLYERNERRNREVKDYIEDDGFRIYGKYYNGPMDDSFGKNKDDDGDLFR